MRHLNLYRYSFKAMASVNEICLYCELRRDADTIAAAMQNEVHRIEEKYSRYRDASVVAEINRKSVIGKATQVDDETATLLDYANTAYLQSEGLFDITSGIFRRAWNFKEAQIPAPASLEAILPFVGWDKVSWTRPNVEFTVSGMEIDFGGFGKEYAVDRAIAIALQMGAENAFINLGGDLSATGPHADGKPWNVGIAHPRKSGQVLTALAVTAGALATSGDYERFIEVDGVRYCHIINPRTGYPVQSFQSVTVAGSSCLVSGTAATTAMLLGLEGGAEYLSEMGLPYLVVDSNGAVGSRGFSLD